MLIATRLAQLRRRWGFAHLYAAAYLARTRVRRWRRIRGAPRQRRLQRVLVIEITHGGLGDSLFHSHLPRIAKTTGAYDKVLISNCTPFRNPAHKRVVWELNPFVDGFTDEPGRLYAPSIAETARDVRGGSDPTLNLLDRVMLNYGLDDKQRHHEPELYYTPAPADPRVADRVLFDPNFVSPNKRGIGPFVEPFLRSEGASIDVQIRPLSWEAMPLNGVSTVIDGSFEEFCDMIAGCRSLYCFETGTAHLAAALKKPATVFYARGALPVFLTSRLHRYVALPHVC